MILRAWNLTLMCGRFPQQPGVARDLQSEAAAGGAVVEVGWSPARDHMWGSTLCPAARHDRAATQESQMKKASPKVAKSASPKPKSNKPKPKGK